MSDMEWSFLQRLSSGEEISQEDWDKAVQAAALERVSRDMIRGLEEQLQQVRARNEELRRYIAEAELAEAALSERVRLT